jgi:hypothetical protein
MGLYGQATSQILEITGTFSVPTHLAIYGIWSGELVIEPPAALQREITLADNFGKVFSVTGGLIALPALVAGAAGAVPTIAVLGAIGVVTSVGGMWATERGRALQGKPMNVRYAFDQGSNLAGIVFPTIAIGKQMQYIKGWDAVNTAGDIYSAFSRHLTMFSPFIPLSTGTGISNVFSGFY